MASNGPPPIPSSSPAGEPPGLVARLGTSGLLLAGGGVLGLITNFLPAATVSVFGLSQSVMVVQDWRGKLGLLAYVASIVFAFLLYPPTGPRKNPLTWAAVGAGALAALMAMLLLVALQDIGKVSGRAPKGLPGMGISAGIGFGAYLNILTGLAVLAGGVLKAREDKLF